jgi:transposase
MDLSWQGKVVQLRLRVRRFFCLIAGCARQIFAERLPFAAALARTTKRLHDTHTEIGLILGGEAGARLAKRLGMPTSPDTLLRRIRQKPLPSIPPVRILGVDDWAIRRGQRYGTILCDLERHCVVDLLPERSAEALSQWLRVHPEVEIITRDRADDYIKGATVGAPQAAQIADRWHLLRNLRDALRRVVDRFQGTIRRLMQVSQVPSLPITQTTLGESVDAEHPSELPKQTRYQQRQQERRQRRQDCYRQVKELHQQGIAHREIAQRLGLNRDTVLRFIRAESFPERAHRQTRQGTDQVVDYLQRRWNEGCRNAAHLYKELKVRGFEGSYYMVRRCVARWRKRSGNKEASGQSESGSRKCFSPRRIVWMLSKLESELKEGERELRDCLERHDRGLAKAAELGRGFREMVRGRQGEAWDKWFDQSQEITTPEELRTFARGLQEDEEAVRAAICSPWSNGQVEGQVNRLKTLKRQMYGRAKFDLLRKRFLLAG